MGENSAEYYNLKEGQWIQIGTKPQFYGLGLLVRGSAVSNNCIYAILLLHDGKIEDDKIPIMCEVCGNYFNL